MHNNIQHKGIVHSVSGGIVVVRVSQLTACSSCRMSGRCHSAEGRSKLINVPTDNPGCYRVGDEVLVSMDAHIGHVAVFWGFGLPLVLMVGTTALVHVAVGDDVAAALCGLAVLIPYFIGLHLFRRMLLRKVTFRLEKVLGIEDITNNQRIQGSL